MAKIANDNCRKIYVTDDNPRNENPKKIRKELLRFISKSKAYNIGNRSLAIKKAINNANPHEIVLVAGKGHEEQQIYKNKIFDTSDRKIIKAIKIKNKILNIEKQNYLQNKIIIKKILKISKEVNFKGISIDTRTIKKGNLFLAIKGKKQMEINLLPTHLKKALDV